MTLCHNNKSSISFCSFTLVNVLVDTYLVNQLPGTKYLISGFFRTF